MNAHLTAGGMPVVLDAGFDLPWWAPFVTPQLIATVLIAALVLLVIAGVAGLIAYRRLRHDPRIGRAKLMLTEQYGAPGPRRNLAQLRLRLDEAVRGARRAVATLDASGGPQGELASLVQRLERAARALDAQLRLMASEPDDATLRDFLRPARDRVEELEEIVGRIRTAVFASLNGEMDATVSQLTADVDREVLALQAGVDALRGLTLGEPPDGTGHREPARVRTNTQKGHTS